MRCHIPSKIVATFESCKESLDQSQKSYEELSLGHFEKGKKPSVKKHKIIGEHNELGQNKSRFISKYQNFADGFIASDYLFITHQK